MKSILTFIILSLFSSVLLAQDVWLHPNKGQWDNRIEYKIDLDLGEMYLEPDGLSYFLYDAKIKHNHSNNSDHTHDQTETQVHAQMIRSTFLNSNWNGKRMEMDSSTWYRNYILGNDSTKWKSGIHSFLSVEYEELYPGINVLVDGKSQKVKITYSVNPGVDPSLIRYKIEGANATYIDEEGQLRIVNQFGEIIESKPIAWTEKDGKRKVVNASFHLDNNIVSFVFPDGYDMAETLVIDPYLVFSTFTGSTADNWGFTAAPDPNGNLFAGGIVFGSGYPVTTGVIDPTYNIGTETGFNIDIGITKFNSTGTTLIYSTYLGGNRNETPNSIVCSPTGELFVFGLTSSINFPMGPSPYDNSFNGGPTETQNSLTFSGTDIFIARLNANGTNLLASTYIGGSGNDGLNTTNLNYNYGDQFRGEIILDPSGNVYVASSTQSGNFPVVLGAQSSLNGVQDAVVFKMPPSLSSLTWSTYYGGGGNETGNSLQVASNGNVYVGGGTTSNNMTFPIGNDLTFNGGLADGYVAQFNGINGSVISGTYMGLGEYDQTYFVQLDVNDNVYVFGQSQSAWPISPGLYGTPNSGQFIRKYTPNLMTINWTTMVGAGTGNVEISPTAFLVSDCYDIYFSGWGGSVNSQNSQAIFSSSNGFQCTSDAFQSNSNGSNFYIGVLAQNAAFLKYGTYMGGTTSSYNHVDGGTSRFDKSGRIYHAVCGACGGNDFGFTSTPGVWSTTNNSANCNLAAFKFELNTIDAIVSAPQTIICLPNPVVFNNNSANGNSFYWSFGDGTFSSQVNPSHVYPSAGDYIVVLVVSDTNGCFSADSVTFDVHIGDFQGGVVQPVGSICPGEPFEFEAYGGTNYAWTPANVLNDPTIFNPIATIFSTTDFTVIISDSCGVDTVYVTLPIYNFSNTISNDTSICFGNSVNLFASGGVSYNWTPSTYLDDATISNPVSTPDVTTEYFVEIESTDGCILTDSVTVSVYFEPPVPVIPSLINLCSGSSVSINVSGADTYSWSPNYQINTLTGSSVIVSPLFDFTYYCDFSNACAVVRDSVFIDVIEMSILAGNDTIICPGQKAVLWASGGVSYYWTPSATLNNAVSSQVFATPLVNTLYTVFGMDANGCSDTASVFVELYPKPFIQTNPDVYAIYGDPIQLSATSTTTGPYIWSPAEYLSCVVCTSPIATPNFSTSYTVTYTDQNGCKASDVVHIYYNPIIYIPNTFTPNSDEFNTGFRVIASNIQSFEMNIFNRWGELIFTMNDLADYWDGTYKGLPCQDGTYVWTLRYIDFSDIPHDLNGHVNLLR